MAQLVLDEGNTSSRGTLSAGESRDWAAANDYVQAKTRRNGITEICGIGALDAERLKARGIEGTGEIAANADNAIAAQAVLDRSPWCADHFFARFGLPRSPRASGPGCTNLELPGS